MNTRMLAMLGGGLLAASSPAYAQRPAPSFVMATYYRCAQGDAPRADAIYKEQIAPILKTEAGAGHISAYGWVEHVEGGDWRRLLYVVGSDLGVLADSRTALVTTMQSPEHARAFEEFGRV